MNDDAIIRELHEIKAMLRQLLHPASTLTAEEQGRQMGECIRRYGPRSPEVAAMIKKQNGGGACRNRKR